VREGEKEIRRRTTAAATARWACFFELLHVLGWKMVLAKFWELAE
jgi:hypothetical protein